MERPFRNSESYNEERKTRDAVKPFLLQCGFLDVEERRDINGKAVMQTLRATDGSGNRVVMAVRLCWRKRASKLDEGFAAFQLLFKVKNGASAEQEIRAKQDREAGEGKTHWLVVKRDGSKITSALLIPISEVLPLWIRQRQIYDQLITAGKLGRRKANPAINGDSPALYVRDDRAPEAVEFLFTHDAIRNLLSSSKNELAEDDTLDDLRGVELSALGSDGAPRTAKVVSGVKRDPAVRREVLRRARGQCEHCGNSRPYDGFLDVHHIFGVENNDRVWTCAALCPNCHRDAHFSPQREEINAIILKIAGKYVPCNTAR